jgi:hypothetical protein
VKQIPNVYKENINFNFTDEDYEFSIKDREWLKSQTAVDMSSISEKQFERIIDCLDKVQQIYRDTTVEKVKEWFDIHADDSLRRHIKKPQLEHIITEYWKKTRNDYRWQVFIRKFWDNPDNSEQDWSAAYRKKNTQERKQLRPKIDA